MVNFYNTFIKLCAKRNLSPSSVARDVGISGAAISGWKNGKMPRDATIQRIADYFGVSAEYLKGENDDNGYYQDEKTAEIAQEIFESPDLRVLFDMARGATPEDIRTAVTMLSALKRKDKNDE